ncbi:hypothetical protein PPYR_09281 [Photinus pyralis]|uniref:BAR domain-containing protein n=1 Tax=Photinus pyralis TaxID=7054 RepID=A0A5N4AM52_PHOPY|nr:protein FAM92A [Photinus pyralis]KAB0798288.1 hypothetical protein PPYR_09281 [Photinus pyralis]
MLSSLRTRNNSEYDTKYVLDRILATERNFAELCHTFGQYSRKIARVRDKGDTISETLLSIAENEDISKSLSEGLTNLSMTFTNISGYGNARAQNIDLKVIQEFSKYENICKNAKEDVKQIFSAQEREMAKRKQCKRVREKKSNRQTIHQAESELIRAQKEVMKTVDSVEDKIITLEKQKLHDLKGILLDLILTEIGYHSKALQQLTKAYNDVNDIDENSDLQAFEELVEIKGAEFKKALSPFKSSQSLSTTVPKKNPGIPTDLRISRSEETLEISSDSEDSTLTEKSSPKMIKKYTKKWQ